MPKKQEKTKKDTKQTPSYGRIIASSEQLEEGGIWSDKSKVAIVGFAPSSMREVIHVWDDPDWEVWGLNQLYMAFPEIANKATRWFQMHSRKSYDAALARDHRHHDWLASQTKFPIYMQQKQPDIPCSVTFPKDPLINIFGRYFTNTISWEIALAIAEGFKTIGIWGVDMATDSEYAYERPSVEFFCGWAKGAGINLIIPERSDILKELWLYPYEDSAPFRNKLEGRMGELQNRINQSAQVEQQNRDIRNQLLGAKENMNYILRTWSHSQREIVTDDNLIKVCPYCETNHDYRLTVCPKPNTKKGK